MSHSISLFRRVKDRFDPHSHSTPDTTLWRLLSGVAVHLTGVGLLVGLAPLKMEDHGLDTSDVGSIAGLYYVGLLLGSQTAPLLIRRLGRHRALIGLMWLAALCSGLHMLGGSKLTFAVLRTASGMCLGAFYVVVESQIVMVAPSSQRARWFSRYIVATAVGLGLGPLVLLAGSWTTLFLFAGLLCVSGVLPLSRTTESSPTLVSVPSTDCGPSFRPFALGIAVVSGVSLGVIYGMLPTISRSLGFSEGVAGMALTSSIVVGAIVQIPFSRCLDSGRVGVVTFGVAAGSALLSLPLAIGPQDAAVWIILAALVGAPLHLLYPAAVAMAQQQVPADAVEKMQAKVFFAYSVGAIIGPALGGFLARQTNAAGSPFSVVSFFATVWCVAYCVHTLLVSSRYRKVSAVTVR